MTPGRVSFAALTYNNRVLRRVVAILAAASLPFLLLVVLLWLRGAFWAQDAIVLGRPGTAATILLQHGSGLAFVRASRWPAAYMVGWQTGAPDESCSIRCTIDRVFGGITAGRGAVTLTNLGRAHHVFEPGCVPVDSMLAPTTENAGSGWIVDIPFAHLAALALLFPALWLLLRFRKSFVRLRRQKIGLCAACGYDLRASPERCPECGTAVPREVAGKERA